MPRTLSILHVSNSINLQPLCLLDFYFLSLFSDGETESKEINSPETIKWKYSKIAFNSKTCLNLMNLFFNAYLSILRERRREREREQRRGRKRRRQKTPSRFELSVQSRCGAQTHKPWYHELSQNQELDA